MSTRYRILNQHNTYFLTLTIVGWVDVFTRKTYKDILIQSLQYCIENKGLIVYGYVIMSNHLHLMASAAHPDKLSDVLRDFKKFTASKIRDQILHSNKESRREWMEDLLRFYAKKSVGKKEFTLWQFDNHPIEMYSPRVIWQKLDYIHLNPVESGLVAESEHYLYSSGSNYAIGEGKLKVTLVEPLNSVGYLHLG